MIGFVNIFWNQRVTCLNPCTRSGSGAQGALPVELIDRLGREHLPLVASLLPFSLCLHLCACRRLPSRTLVWTLLLTCCLWCTGEGYQLPHLL